MTALVDKQFPVIEIFGPTVQGEGAVAGKVTHFVRFGGCDYRCTWCDSSHAVLPEEVRSKSQRMTVIDILARLDSLPGLPDWVTLSGGNPALHDLSLLVQGLHGESFKVAVETQGSIWKPWLAEVDLLTVSPKPPSSDQKQSWDHLRLFLIQAREVLTMGKPLNLVLKVPVFDHKDFLFAKKVHAEYPEHRFYLSVITRMGGLFGTFAEGAVDTDEDVLRRYSQVVDWAVNDPDMGDVTVFPQLHVLIWGHARGH